MYTDEQITEIYKRNSKMLYRLCYSFMKNPADAEDVLSEIFVKFIHSGKTFNDLEHEKAWFIVCCQNLCKDALKHWQRKNEDIDDHIELGQEEQKIETGEVMAAIMSLDVKYQTVIYLHYYEDMTTGKIAETLGESINTILGRLRDGRQKLKAKLGDDFCEA